MKKLIYLLLIVLLSQSSFGQTKSFATEKHQSPDGKYTYTTVTNDPMKVRTYVLSNGLTVMMAVNKK